MPLAVAHKKTQRKTSRKKERTPLCEICCGGSFRCGGGVVALYALSFDVVPSTLAKYVHPNVWQNVIEMRVFMLVRAL